MAAVVSVASARGGCSTTTLVVGVGGELAFEGHTLVVLDADLTQHATTFGENAHIHGLSVVGEVDEATILENLHTNLGKIMVALERGREQLAARSDERTSPATVDQDSASL